MNGSSKAEDNKKAIKQKKPKVKQMISINAQLCPNHRGRDQEHRVDYNVANYQLPVEEGLLTKVLERVRGRRTWCIRQRVLWLEETFAATPVPASGHEPTVNVPEGAAGSSSGDRFGF